MKVSVALARPEGQVVIELDLPEGATVAEAIAASGIDATGLTPGIWSRECALDASLREGDRVELYRPLVVDVKQARRERARKR